MMNYVFECKRMMTMRWIGRLRDFRFAHKDKPVFLVCKAVFDCMTKPDRAYALMDGNLCYLEQPSRFPMRRTRTFPLILEGGFHSYDPTNMYVADIPERTGKVILSRKDLMHLFGSVESTDVLVQAVIPKGSIYFVNRDGQVISSRLKIVWDEKMKINKTF